MTTPALLTTVQRFGAVLEALEKGQPVDLSAMPPAPEGQYGDGGGNLLRLGLAGPPPPILLLWVPQT